MTRNRQHWWVVLVVGGLLAFFWLSGTANATPDPEEDGHKVAICHRTASDTNPYVYIEVDEASLSPGHLDNADPGHKPTFWKSDGTWRGVPHVAGDPKDDYLAQTEADCEDTTTPSPSPSPDPDPSPTPDPEPSPTPDPVPVPDSEDPAPPPGTKQWKPGQPLPVTGVAETAMALGAVAALLAVTGGAMLWATRRPRGPRRWSRAL